MKKITTNYTKNTVEILESLEELEQNLQSILLEIDSYNIEKFDTPIQGYTLELFNNLCKTYFLTKIITGYKELI